MLTGAVKRDINAGSAVYNKELVTVSDRILVGYGIRIRSNLVR